MANESIERAVDDLIAKGRVQREMRNEYVQHLESVLKDDLLRGADYTNKTKALATERRQAEEWLNQERQKFQNERQNLERWQGQVRSQIEESDRIVKELPKLTARLAAYEQALEDYQIKDKVVLPPEDRPNIPSITDRREPTRTMPDQPSDPSRMPYLTREAAAGALRDMMVLQGKINRINAQHMKLFGEPLDDDLSTHFFETGEDPEQHWKVKYNVEGKRAEIASKARESEMAQMREQIRAEIMQSIALDPSRVVGGQGQQHRGGLTPVLEQYVQSRALAHNGVEAGQKQDDFIPPERRPDIASQRDRIDKASRMFVENFDIMGRPTTDKGRELSRRYSE